MTTAQAQQYFDERVKFYTARLKAEREYQEVQSWLRSHSKSDLQYTSVKTEYLQLEKELES